MEDSVEDAVDDAVEDAVEDTVEDTVEQATSSSIKKKIALAIGGSYNNIFLEQILYKNDFVKFATKSKVDTTIQLHHLCLVLMQTLSLSDLHVFLSRACRGNYSHITHH